MKYSVCMWLSNDCGIFWMKNDLGNDSDGGNESPGSY